MTVSTPLSSRKTCLRRIRASEVNAAGRIRKAAFMPRREGQDRDGLSVSIEDRQLVSVHRRHFESPGYRASQIGVRAVREIPPLDVVPDPTPDDRAHALIIGIPDRTLGAEETAAAERMAQELSRRATLYTFQNMASDER